MVVVECDAHVLRVSSVSLLVENSYGARSFVFLKIMKHTTALLLRYAFIGPTTLVSIFVPVHIWSLQVKFCWFAVFSFYLNFLLCSCALVAQAGSLQDDFFRHKRSVTVFIDYSVNMMWKLQGTYSAFVRLHEKYPLKSRKIHRLLQRYVSLLPSSSIYVIQTPAL